jgi:CRISPR-associated protein Csd2
MATPQPAATEDVPVISARDADVSIHFPSGFEDWYEVYSYRNAAMILRHACGAEFQEIVQALMTFRIRTEDLTASGGNKSKIAIGMETLLKPNGWNETRITGDLRITRRTASRVGRTVKAGKNKGATKYEAHLVEEAYRIPGFVDGHKIDFVKGRVALDMEWNSKDQTFDRDLYAIRAFYETNIVTAGVLLTRSKDLAPLFAEIHKRTDIPDFKQKYGASTTWIGKLLYRLDAGRGGGCPILVIGIKSAIVSDFDTWKATHPVRRHSTFVLDDEPTDLEDD